MHSLNDLEPAGLRFHPRFVRPMGFDQFRRALAGEAVSLEMMGNAAGRTKPVRVWGSITFDQKFPFYALVPGGVLRPELLPDASFALDRGVVSALRQWHESRAGGEALGAAIRWLNRPGMSSSPFLAALEGSMRKLPTFEEYSRDLDDIEAVIRAVLPAIDVLDSRRDNRRTLMYETSVKFSHRGRAETVFLQRVNEFLSNTVAGRRRSARRDEILEVAHELGLQCSSLVVVAALAKLYEAPQGQDGGSAQGVLKFKKIYPDESAYNALADLHQLEVMASCAARLPNPALLTTDRRLALFWAGLGMRCARFNSRGVAEVDFNPYHLFAHLSDDECLALAERLKGRGAA
ncbi:MAG: hypothetical protein M9894_32965 [Planctomycetes bacterium]|nr:hypothetical protein [Planctomycetota bacterium]